MPTPGEERTSIDLVLMLGGPLIAAINAQAAISAVNFHTELGLRELSPEQDSKNAGIGDPVHVTFKHPQQIGSCQPAIPAYLIYARRNGGMVHSTVPIIAITGGDGSGATALATIDAARAVTVPTLTSADDFRKNLRLGPYSGGGGIWCNSSGALGLALGKAQRIGTLESNIRGLKFVENAVVSQSRRGACQCNFAMQVIS